MRPLLENGYVYLSCPPLYKITINPKSKNPEIKFALTDKELNEIINSLDKPYKIDYLKGLGELCAEELWVSTMNPETRTLIQVNIDNIEESENTINMCMNKNAVSTRKQFIMNGESYEIV